MFLRRGRAGGPWTCERRAVPPVVRDVRPEGVARRRRSIAEPRIQRERGTRTEDEQEQERWPFPSPSAPARGRGGRRVSRQLGGPRATHPGQVTCPSRGRPQALRRGQRSSRAPHPGAQGGARGPRGRADAARTVGPAGTDAGRGRKGGRGTRPPDPGSRGEHERRSLRPLPGRTRCHTAAAAPDALLGGRDRAWVSPAWTGRGSVHQQHL